MMQITPNAYFVRVQRAEQPKPPPEPGRIGSLIAIAFMLAVFAFAAAVFVSWWQVPAL